jgi:hypothetical protein
VVRSVTPSNNNEGERHLSDSSLSPHVPDVPHNQLSGSLARRIRVGGLHDAVIFGLLQAMRGKRVNPGSTSASTQGRGFGQADTTLSPLTSSVET